MLRASWLAIALIGCGNRGADPEACRADADALTRLLSATDHGTPMVFEQKNLTLVLRPELPELRPSSAPIVYVTSLEIAMRGAAYTLADLTDRLASDHRQLADDVSTGKAKANSHAIRIALDDSAPWSQVVALVDAAARAGFDEPEFVFARPAIEPPPEVRSSIDGELDALFHAKGENRASEFAKIALRVVDSCPPVVAIFGHVEPTEDKAKYIIDHIGPALVECDCRLDLPAFRSVMWRLLRNPYPTGGLAVHVDAAAPPIELAAGTPWRETSKRFTRETRSISLRVK